MPDVRIKDITTEAVDAHSDDYIPLDGATNGTRKAKAIDFRKKSFAELIAALDSDSSLRNAFLTVLGLTPAQFPPDTGIWNVTASPTDGTPQSLNSLIARMKAVDPTLVGSALPAPLPSAVNDFAFSELYTLDSNSKPYQFLEASDAGLTVYASAANQWGYFKIVNKGTAYAFIVEAPDGIALTLNPGESVELFSGGAV